MFLFLRHNYDSKQNHYLINVVKRSFAFLFRRHCETRSAEIFLPTYGGGRWGRLLVVVYIIIISVVLVAFNSFGRVNENKIKNMVTGGGGIFFESYSRFWSKEKQENYFVFSSVRNTFAIQNIFSLLLH